MECSIPGLNHGVSCDLELYVQDNIEKPINFY